MNLNLQSSFPEFLSFLTQFCSLVSLVSSHALRTFLHLDLRDLQVRIDWAEVGQREGGVGVR